MTPDRGATGAPDREAAIRLVDAYLQRCEDRDLDGAAAALAPGCRLVFPGGRVFASLAEMAAAAAGRYRWVRKHRDGWDVAPRPDGATAVVSQGRLYGENRHGVAFEDVRYVDLFVLRDGLVAEQHVWNDLEVSGVLERTHTPERGSGPGQAAGA